MSNRLGLVLRLLRTGARRHAALPTLIVGLVVTLAAAAISTSMTVRHDAATAVDASFQAHDGPDLVIRTTTQALDEVVRTLSSDPRVRLVGRPRPIAAGRAAHGDASVAVVVNGIDTGSMPALNRPVLTAGRLPEAPGEIAFDAAAAESLDVSPGDQIDIDTAATSRAFRVVGLAYDFTDCLFPSCDPVRAWALRDDLPSPNTTGRALVAVDLHRSDDAERVGQAVDRMVELGDIGFDAWPDTREDLLTENTFFSAFIGALGLIGLVAATVVISGTISTRAASRRHLLAQLRSLGCTRGQVVGMLVLEHALIGLTACALGLGVSILAAPGLRVGPLGLLDADAAGVPTSRLLTSAAVVMATVLLTVVGPAVRAARHDIVAALDASPAISPSPLACGRLLGTARLPLSIDLGVRSVLRHGARAAATAIAVAVAVATTTIACSINTTMNDFLAHPALMGDRADAYLHTPATVSAGSAGRILDDVPEVERWFTRADTTAVVDRRSVHVVAIGGDLPDADDTIGAGRPLTATGQAVAGYGLFDASGWDLGQQLRLQIGDRTIEVTLVGWSRDTEDDGEVLQIHHDDLARVDTVVAPRVAIVAADHVTPEQLETSIDDAFDDDVTVEVRRTDHSRLDPFKRALMAMTLLITTVAFANLIANAVIGTRERHRRSGLLRAVGATRSTIVREAMTSSMLIGVVALAIGSTIGVTGAHAIGDLITSEIGAGPGLSRAPTVAQGSAIAGLVIAVVAITTWLATKPTLGRSIPDLLQEST